MRALNDENRASRWQTFVSSFRKKKTRLIEALTTHKEEEEKAEEHGMKTRACKEHSSKHRKRQREQGYKRYCRVVLPSLPCISGHSSFIRSTSTKVLPFSPPSSSSSSSSHSDDKIRNAANSLVSTSIPTSEDASSSMPTINKASAIADDNHPCKLVLQEQLPCKKVFSLVIPAQAKATAACSTRKRALVITGKKEIDGLVVKLSQDSYADFFNSIAERILHNMDTLWEEAQLRNVLGSYLNLNAPRHHTHIKLAFADAITTIDSLL